MQYGPRLYGLAVSLNSAHFIPLERTSQILDALCGARLSDGTIVLNLNLAAERLAGFETHLKAASLTQPVLHADETGSPVNGKLQWMYVVSCAQLTLYGQHAKRGFAALDAMNVLPHFQGVVVHDAWSAYWALPGGHTLCGAHLLRDLPRLAEQVWAEELRGALRTVYHQRKEGTLTVALKSAFEHRFDALLEAGLIGRQSPSTFHQAGMCGMAS